MCFNNLLANETENYYIKPNILQDQLRIVKYDILILGFDTFYVTWQKVFCEDHSYCLSLSVFLEHNMTSEI